jgi:phosphate-selective porin OprO/OprP
VPVDVFQGAGLLIAKTPDGQFTWWIDGRLMLDTAAYAHSDNSLANGVEMRRGRVALNMVLWKTWASQFDVDVADNAIDVKDAWIGYTGLTRSLVKVGNFKEPFGLESLTSSRYISFTERALIDNFSPDRHIGAAFTHWESRWQATGGAFGPQLADTVDAIGQDQAYSLTGRVTVLPFISDRSLVHVGFASSYETPKAATDPTLKDANQMRLRARPETHVNRGRFIDTGKISNVDHRTLVGVEAAAVAGPFSFQSEYNRATFARTLSTLAKPTVDGWYAYVSWFPTGESRPYDRAAGEFDRVMPKSRRGALEVLTRFSQADLNDFAAGITGGSEKITTLGLNWYVNANVRVMTNYLFVTNDQYAKGDRNYTPNDSFNVLQARLQLMF